MDPRLPTFIDLLENMNLISFDILGDTEENFDNRFRIQKYVFLSQYFGLDLDYQFTMYLHGPYSPDLTNDYYALTGDVSYFREDLPDEFDSDRFYTFVNEMDSNSLEATATLLSLNEHFHDRECLIDRVTNMKSHIPQESIEENLRRLETNQLVVFN